MKAKSALSSKLSVLQLLVMSVGIFYINGSVSANDAHIGTEAYENYDYEEMRAKIFQLSR